MKTQIANLAIRKAVDLNNKDQDCVKAIIKLDKGTKVDKCGTWKQVPTLALRGHEHFGEELGEDEDPDASESESGANILPDSPRRELRCLRTTASKGCRVSHV
jgi:hypothetical protein